MGVRRGSRGEFAYHPPPATRLVAGGAIVALGEPAELEAVEAILAGERQREPTLQGEILEPRPGVERRQKAGR